MAACWEDADAVLPAVGVSAGMPPALDATLAAALADNAHRPTLLRLDAELRKFVNMSARTSCTLPAALSAHHRACAAAIAETCGLATQEVDAPSGGTKLSISKTPQTHCPPWKLADVIAAPVATHATPGDATAINPLPAQQPAVMMQRRTGRGTSPGGAGPQGRGATSIAGRGSPRRTLSGRSLEEREAEYARARQRLLGSGDGDDGDGEGADGTSAGGADACGGAGDGGEALVDEHPHEAAHGQQSQQRPGNWGNSDGFGLPGLDGGGGSGSGSGSGDAGSGGGGGGHQRSRKAIFRDRASERLDPEFRRQPSRAQQHQQHQQQYYAHHFYEQQFYAQGHNSAYGYDVGQVMLGVPGVPGVQGVAMPYDYAAEYPTLAAASNGAVVGGIPQPSPWDTATQGTAQVARAPQYDQGGAGAMGGVRPVQVPDAAQYAQQHELPRPSE